MTDTGSGFEDLHRRIEALDEVFQTSSILSRPIDKSEIIRYYRDSALGYTLLHSDLGSVHMALNPNGQYSSEGYARHVELISPYLPTHHGEAVLELGCGKGYNIRQLAECESHLDYVGVDLSQRHIRAANRALGGFGNAVAQVADFHNMPFEDGFFRASFAVESLCHSTDPQALLREIRRVMSPGGRLVVFDAWRTDRSLHVDQRTKSALELTERSMAVDNAIAQSEWLRIAETGGWQLTYHQVLSREVMPNLQRFERMAQRFLDRPRLARTLAKTIPGRLLQNAISGYLMAQTVKDGLHTYDMIVLNRR